MSKIINAVTRLVIKKIIRPKLSANTPINKQRKMLELVQGILPIVSGVEREDIKLNHCSMIKLEVSDKTFKKPNALLYLHGGAYAIGSANTHKEFASTLAKRTGQTVYLLDYRLAPEHAFPAALDDSVEAVNFIQQRHDKLAICGDSAGGGLSLATAQYLRDKQLPQAQALVVLSPWTNLLCNNQSYDTNKNIDPMITQGWLQATAKLYAQDKPLDGQYLSPGLHDTQGLPSTLIQVGEDEVLLSDSLQLNEKMLNTEIDCRLQVFPNMWHIFQLQATLIKDGRAAITEICKFLNETLNSSQH